MNGHPVSLTTTTIAGGGYDFNGLLAGTYTVQVERPSPYLVGGSNVGSTGGSSATDSIQGIPLDGGGDSVRNDVGFITPASLSGYAYFDYNRNGVFDSNDFGIAHVKITSTGTDDVDQSVTETTWVTGNNLALTSSRACGPVSTTSRRRSRRSSFPIETMSARWAGR